MKISTEKITSRNNEMIKWAASLSEKKGRALSSSFICEGIKLTREALSIGLPVSHIFVNEKKAEAIMPIIEEAIDSAKEGEMRIITVTDSVYEKISTEKGAQGVLSVIKYLDNFKYCDIIYKEDFLHSQDERAIILYSVRDPSNLGAVIRSAVAFGVEHIILSSDCADVYSPKTVRAAMGSLFRVNITTVRDFGSLISALKEKGRRIFAAELRPGAVSLEKSGIKRCDCVIIGNEGHGIPEEISMLCDGSIFIPISDKTESLNASVAAAVFMWEQGRI